MKPIEAVARALRPTVRLAYRCRISAKVCNRLRRRVGPWPADAGALWIDDFDGDLEFRCDLREHIGSSVFWTGSYGPDDLALLARFVEEDSVIVDVGANQGVFTLYLAKRARRGRLLAFEPEPANGRALQGNLDRNGFENTEVIPLGLSDATERREIYVPSAAGADGTFNRSRASLYRSSEVDEPAGAIELTTLDDFVRDRGIDRVDLIKIDIEGNELPALRGMTATLASHRPLLHLELNQIACRTAGHDPHRILDFLFERDYSVYRIRTDDRLWIGSTRRPGLVPLGDDRRDLAPSQNLLCIGRPGHAEILRRDWPALRPRGAR